MTEWLKNDKGLYFLPLGGSNEIGMNLNLYRYQGKFLMVDLGIGFADDWHPGVEVIVPDIDFILEHKQDLLGLVLTHAHEDHIGAIPYLWEDLGCPMYATPFTAGLIRHKLDDDRITKKPKIHEVKPGGRFSVGPFDLEMVQLTHSVPEMNGLAIHTEHGVVMHTGDWKFDANPLVGEASNLKRLEELGNEGVLALVCDSTNVFVEGEAGSEAMVREHLNRVMQECQERVLVTTFASNIARLETVLLAAKDAGRKVAMAGRSLWRMLETAREAGYLLDCGEVLTDKQGMELPRDKVCFLTTGCQGELRAALWKIARFEHPAIKLSKGDTVIFSSRDIPGNHKRIGILQNMLLENGLKVVTAGEEPIHVSGHPARNELRRMYQLTQPKISVPVHGEQRHMREHAKLAKTLQVPHAVVGKNGAVIDLLAEKPAVIAQVHSGYICVDGETLLPADSSVMRMRRRTRDDGLIIVSTVMDKDWGLMSEPRITAPGLLHPHDDADWIEEMQTLVANQLSDRGKKPNERDTGDKVRRAVRKFCKENLGKRPVIEWVYHRL